MDALADTARGELYRWPEVLPNGRAAVFTILSSDGFQLAALELKVGVVRPLDLEGTNPRFVLPGYLVFGRLDGAVLAAPFDADALRVTGGPLPVAGAVMVGIEGAANRGVSRAGAVAYVMQSSADRTLARGRSCSRKSGVGDLLRHPRLNHRVEVVGGIEAEACSRLLREFFREKR
ncbi:MAG: hypothetical protein ACREN5_08275 [Gemmatimonadales bacterium]